MAPAPSAAVLVAVPGPLVAVPGGLVTMSDPLVALPGGLPQVAFDRAWAFLGLPVGLVLLWALIGRRSGPSETGRRPRLALLASRAVLLACLVTAAAGPYTVAARETPGDPRVTLLVDESASMAVVPAVADRLEREIEREGVPVSRVTVASGNASPIGDGIAANVEPHGSLVVVSDGRVTGGGSLGAAAELAAGANATISAVALGPASTERYVRIDGPEKTSVGVDNRFLVRVGGTALEGTRTAVTVTVDGERVAAETVEGAGAFEVVRRLNETGEHRLTARIEGADAFSSNDVFYRTVRVVEKPRVLYVRSVDYPLSGFLSQLYEVETATRVPEALSSYHAVVIQNQPAGSLGEVDALSSHVIDGGGLVVVGGPSSFDRGGYATSPVASLLPVRMGEGTADRATIVLVIDVSGSAGQGMRLQKALALDVLSQLGNENRVGVVAFNEQAYEIAGLTPLSTGRATLEDRISRLRAGGGTQVAAGLHGARALLGSGPGTVILLSDGKDQGTGALGAARELRAGGARVISVGVGQEVDVAFLREVASVSGGTFYRANETNRLRILFGDASGDGGDESLVVVDPEHFITAGVRTRARLAGTNRVSVKGGADFLVASAGGSPVVTAWTYGLGRVVAVTGYGPTGGLDGLLSPPDSLLVSKSVNWAIGDPERLATGVADVSDTRVGEATAVVYRGDDRPSVPGVSFARVGPDAYRATVRPDAPGFASILGAEYAVNYPVEYASLGTDPALERAVAETGGRTFEATEAAEIAAFAKRRATRVREVRTAWDAPLLAAAILLYLLEVGARRLSVYRGRGAIP